MIDAKETIQLAEISGPGMLRHIWLTTYNIPDTMRGVVIRAYWDGQEHPSIEAPIGDFFGFAHGATEAYASMVHSVGSKSALNLWLPMPFARHARITLTNELSVSIPVFFQIDYTLGDVIDHEDGYLHASFRRETRTQRGHDFELLPLRRGAGRYIGAIMGVRPSDPNWWGEGEVKIYLDDDTTFPTICGTGSEDYVGLSWGMQRNVFPMHGASLVTTGRADTGPVSMYRWHLSDPIVWHHSIRVAIQQIGLVADAKHPPRSFSDYLGSLVEREDDWSTCTFWYERIPSAPLPTLPDLATRLHGLKLYPDLDALPLQRSFSISNAS